MSQEYPHTIVIQFRNTGDFGSMDELDWRHKQEDRLDNLLQSLGLGHCDGGQSGSGSMEIFLMVNDISAAAQAVTSWLTDVELIGFCKIASLSALAQAWTVHHPSHAEFSVWHW